ncbi:pyruvate dehydrogenase [Actinoplanes utahensis]|uniref:Pyruvate dehydrogenase E1 component subunit beta n=2 Tax=Actinoplanes utahensis TaxID=1869 RepID=A0A0A6UTH0_ACTUT|nr:pyruvate dehydrogenase [Actinoplanes utahensis]
MRGGGRGRGETVAENLNRGLHAVLGADEGAYLLGEDVEDPYGGAFRITRGLSTRFPDRVRSTPISEGGVVGAGAGLALAGDTAIVEMMFGDFVGLAFDQIVNFASKTVTMYGTRVPMRLVVRCPVGGNRGYGPTHSQSPQKHFIGVPNLALYELTGWHDSTDLLREMLAVGVPALLFEDKILYGRPHRRPGPVDDLFRAEPIGTTADGPPVMHVHPVGLPPDFLVIATGGLADRVHAALRTLLVEHDLAGHMLIPARLHPFQTEVVAPWVRQAGTVFVAEESTAGGTWGAEVAHRIAQNCWPALSGPVRLLHSRDAVIPAAPHLERTVIVQEETIGRAIREAFLD